jgi:Fe2+ or Zn2+ uptake regulation protein
VLAVLSVSTSHALVCRRCGSRSSLIVSDDLARLVAACAAAHEPFGADRPIDEVRLDLAGICAACSTEQAG